MDVKTYFGLTQNEISEIVSCLRERERILRYSIAEDNILLIMHGETEAEHVRQRVAMNQQRLDLYTHLIGEFSSAQITNNTNQIKENHHAELRF